MKTYKNLIKFVLTALAVLFLFNVSGAFAQTNPNHVKVEGYSRKDGTYVPSHYRTAPNSTNRDNFSTRGNTNPYTGRPGYIAPDNRRPNTNSNSSTKSNILPVTQIYNQNRIQIIPHLIHIRNRNNSQADLLQNSKSAYCKQRTLGDVFSPLDSLGYGRIKKPFYRHLNHRKTMKMSDKKSPFLSKDKKGL